MAAAPGNASLLAHLWQTKTVEDQRKVWVIGGPDHDISLKATKSSSFSQRTSPQSEHIELATLPSSPTSSLEVPAGASPQADQHLSPVDSAQEPAVASQPQPPSYHYCTSFDLAQCAISVLKFAPGSTGMLAWGAADGVAYVATTHQPPRLLQVLDRHQAKVADLDWSPDAALLLTCSADCTACLWQVDSGQLVRAMRSLAGPLACCCFHPSNPNILLLGDAAGHLLALNASTGRLIAKAELQAAPMSGVGAANLAPAGPNHLLVADSRACLHLYDVTLNGSGTLVQLAPLAYFPPPGNRFHEPACLEYAAHSLLAGGPAVLLALSSGEIMLSRLHEKPWRLEVAQEMRTAQASAKVRASLRPGVPGLRPELLMAGGEDCKVHLVDISSAQQPPRLMAALAAHQAPVLGVAWSEDEGWLASCDKSGLVVLWQAEAGGPCKADAQVDLPQQPEHTGCT